MTWILVLCIGTATSPCAAKEEIRVATAEQCRALLVSYEQDKRVTAYCRPEVKR